MSPAAAAPQVPPDSDFCAVCEEREFKKIRGWLYLLRITVKEIGE